MLDSIERSAQELKQLRVQGDPTQLAKLEPQILRALREVGRQRTARQADEPARR
ncbi:hypothetical protein [Bradyrhizobium sp. B117]|uniref:hypothetical protein n=1 Tax=Bradyrhizobium sp. B117 TaxID=3140246 RepID=UPI0031834BEE